MKSPRYTINRHLLTLAPRQAFLDWLMAVDPNPPEGLTIAQLRDDREAFLIPDDAAGGTEQAVEWVGKHWRMFFEHCLNAWITDEQLWPKITRKMFREWFDVEYHSMVWDLGTESLSVEDWDADDNDGEAMTYH